MAVPKKRTGKSAQAKRRANWKATTPATTTCKNCGAVVLTHTVCPECRTYKGKVESAKGQAMLEKKLKNLKKLKKNHLKLKLKKLKQKKQLKKNQKEQENLKKLNQKKKLKNN